MWTIKVWQKLALCLLIVGLPLAVLGYRAIRNDRQRLAAEQKRLAGLQYLQGLRRLNEAVQKHRTASLLAHAGSSDAASFQLQLPVHQDDVDEEIEGLDALDAQFAALLPLSEQWDDLKESWEDLEAAAPFSKGAEHSDELHARVLANLRALTARTAERAGIGRAGPGERAYLFDSLAFELLPQVDLLGRVQTLATPVAQRRKITPAERAQLGQLLGQLELLREGVDRNAQGIRAHEELRERCDTPLFVHASACDDLIEFIQSALLEGEQIDVDSSALRAATQKPRDTALALFDAEFQAAQTLTERELKATRRDQYVAAAITGGGLLFGLAALCWVGRGIGRQVRAVADTVQQVELGNTQARAAVRSRDELGRLAVALNRLLDQGVGSLRLQAEQTQAALAELLAEVQAVAAGNLTTDAQVTREQTGPLADALNFLIRQLRQLVGQVRNGSLQLSAAAGQVQEITELLAQGTAGQVEQIEQHIAGVDTVTAALQRIAGNAAAAAEAAQRALSSSREGREAVQRLTRGLGHIRDEVRETARHIRRLGANARPLGEAARAVEDLAEWTNILALNSSLHAAQAGSNGSPYQLIGEQVERLAQRAADAAGKMTALTGLHDEAGEALTVLEETLRDLTDGSLAVQQANHALAEIESVAQRLSQLVGVLAITSRQQTQGARAVGLSARKVADALAQSAKGSRHALGFAHGLTRLAGELHEATAAFQLPEIAGPGESFVSLLEGSELPGNTDGPPWVRPSADGNGNGREAHTGATPAPA